MNILPSMNIFKLKPSGPKARVIALECRQLAEMVPREGFAPVVKFVSVRITLAMAAEHNLMVHQMDVVTAFLHGEIDKDVYIAVT